MSPRELQERILSESIPEPNSGCWLWLGLCQSAGYGFFYIKGRRTTAHRISYESFIGPVPDGLTLDHLCRTRICVNPWHLEPVSNAENCRRGSNAKLSYAKAAEIRVARAAGENPASLARKFGVSVAAIKHVCAGRSWTDEVLPNLNTPMVLRGEKNPLAKLTERAVMEMRALSAFGFPLKWIAKKYGVTEGTAHPAISGRTWKHVPFPETLPAEAPVQLPLLSQS